MVFVMHSCMSLLMVMCSFKWHTIHHSYVRKMFIVSLSLSRSDFNFCISQFMQWNACHLMHFQVSTKKETTTTTTHTHDIPICQPMTNFRSNCEKIPFKYISTATIDPFKKKKQKINALGCVEFRHKSACNFHVQRYVIINDRVNSCGYFDSVYSSIYAADRTWFLYGY